MKTYQDLLNCVTELERQQYVFGAIAQHQVSDMVKMAREANNYYRWQNTAINNFIKLLYTVTGKAVPDNFSANHKCASNFYFRFITQEIQYLLGNGVIFNNDATKEKLGGAKFDYQLQQAATSALNEGVSFGFYNYDHVDMFKLTEFVPIWDEEDGALKAGIRYWQIDNTKPMRATLYELDGYTEYIKRSGKEVEILHDKQSYKQLVRTSAADGEMIYNYDNYDGFPIVPLWSPLHQSAIVGLKSQIDAYDLIKSGFANDLDDASMIYWTIENAGGMDDVDLAKFVQRMKTVRAANLEDDGARAEAHTFDVPYSAREAYLTRLENDMYNDNMALNVQQIAAGNVTATAIEAAYMPLDNKADLLESCVGDFLNGLLALAGINDTFTFKRSRVSNQTEETQMVLSAAAVLDDETIRKHLPFLSVDELEGIEERYAEEQMNRLDDAAGDDE